ncbi:hypothetical protein BCT04_15255 [Vibrio breoganii]|uniref:FixH family protein n=1 Tax=Vibrio breoganii TaxID=553239 RepID=UPI000C85E228|nr:FixH family protein [Vibrio breoganii]PMG05181.1 hypothetical protein BCV00_13440 [Vibrio breoganii]PMK30713.1 hypothetical protein BCU03_08780 [Vibrio breoganii]PMO63705.1 hypothetical protein BCT04_15255 [Vibrio breoganii]
MKSSLKVTSVILIGLLSFVSTSAFAIDSYAKIKKQRPEHIDTSTQITSAGISIAYFALVDNSSSVPLNKIHSWKIVITKRDGSPVTNAEIETIAEMPEHLHGMTTTPTISETDVAGEYLIEGMNFHMPGWWVASFDVSGYGSRALVRFHLVVGEDSLVGKDSSQDHMLSDHSKMNDSSHDKH